MTETHVTCSTGDCFDPFIVYENLESINAKNNEDFKTLPNAPNLKFIGCHRSGITEIPHKYEKLEELLIDDCKLKTLYRFERLRIASVNNNLINYVRISPYLRRLSIRGNTMSEIPEFPLLEFLDCADNEYLVRIRGMMTLICLNCDRTALKRIEYFPSLEYLNCSYTDITAIPPLENLRELICRNNTIEEVGELPMLEHADYHNTEKK